MNVYVDTSVVLRVLLGQANVVDCWSNWEQAYVSELIRTEFFRTIDRLRLQGVIGDIDRVQIGLDFEIFYRTCHRIPVSEKILRRAEQPFPTVIGTLDAIHLTTLLLTQDQKGMPMTLLTHDEQLARTALACGVEVLPVLVT
jgi:predicted nucleic acid-binding protein